MADRHRRWLIVVSAVTAAVGAIVTVVYFFQPWRSCDDEDTSAGCAMLPADANVMLIAILVTLSAASVLVISLLAKEKAHSR